MESTNELESLMSHLGDFGIYQCLQFILHLLPAITAGIHMLSFQVVGATPDHRCQIPNVDLSSTSNFTIANLETYIPKSKEGSYDNCYMFNLTNKNNSTIKCESWVYDTTYHKSSRGMEWNLVCDRKWMGAVAQSVFLFGVLVGVVTLGSAADKYGRRTIFCWSAVFQLIFGVAAAFVPHYYVFLIVQFFYGAFGSAGCYITAFVLCMELIGPSKRTMCGVSLQAAFAVGIIIVAAWGVLIQDRQMLQLVYGLHGILLLGHLWWLDESIRWLWAKGNITEAVKLVQKGLRINGNSSQLDLDEYLLTSETCKKDVSAVNLFDLFKIPILRTRTINICFSWFANSLVYYGLSLSTGKLYGNPFVLLSLIGVVEIPSNVIAVFLMDRIGRRFLTFFLMILGGIACIIAAFLFKGSMTNTVFVIMGKFSIASSFAIMYNYSAELFPTVVRNSALGLGGMCARLSATLTPLIYLLDYFNSSVSIIIFGAISIISGIFVLLLPETMGSALPQTLEDSEAFTNNSLTFACSCCNKTDAKNNKSNEQMEPLENA